MDIDFLKQTSIRLTEGIEVADTDIIVNAIIEQKQYSSLLYQICEVSPFSGPTGGVFALVYEGDKVVLKRGEAVVEDDAIEDTGFTMEALQDLEKTFGKSMVGFVSRCMAGVSAKKENAKVLQKIAAWAAPSPDLTLLNRENAETVLFQVQQRVSELILDINSASFKSLDAFVVLPKVAAASLLAMGNRLIDNTTESGLYMGANSRVKFYMNPDLTSIDCYVGIKSNMPGQSSVIASPYQHSLLKATNPETGEERIFNVNRYAITESALSAHEKMLYKFKIL